MPIAFEDSWLEPITGCVLEDGVIYETEELFADDPGYASNNPAPVPFSVNSWLLDNGDINTKGHIYADQEVA